MREEWRPVVGYEGLYEVSNMGNVKSLNYRGTGKEGILKPYDDGHGYLKVMLSKEGKDKQYRINRLVAQAFIENPDNLPEVNHKDKVRTNNCVDNLEWCTTQYNVEYSKAKAVIGINKVSGLILEFSSLNEASRQLDISPGNICSCLKGKYKSAGGFYWMYKNNNDDDIE